MKCTCGISHDDISGEDYAKIFNYSLPVEERKAMFERASKFIFDHLPMARELYNKAVVEFHAEDNFEGQVLAFRSVVEFVSERKELFQLLTIARQKIDEGKGSDPVDPAFLDAAKRLWSDELQSITLRVADIDTSKVVSPNPDEKLHIHEDELLKKALQEGNARLKGVYHVANEEDFNNLPPQLLADMAAEGVCNFEDLKRRSGAPEDFGVEKKLH